MPARTEDFSNVWKESFQTLEKPVENFQFLETYE